MEKKGIRKSNLENKMQKIDEGLVQINAGIEQLNKANAEILEKNKK